MRKMAISCSSTCLVQRVELALRWQVQNLAVIFLIEEHWPKSLGRPCEGPMRTRRSGS